MREFERDPLRLEHMLEAASNVKEFMAGKTLEDIKNDKILFFAVVKNIEIIGEAAFMLTKEFKETHHEIKWKDIIGMRHVLVHDYYRISPIQLFKVYQENIESLILNLQAIIQNIDRTPNQEIQ